MRLNVNKKIDAIISKLNETDYAEFDGNKDEAMSFLSRQLTAFPKYANTVIKEQIMMPIWKNRYDGQDLRDKIQDMDSKRRSAHENAIAAAGVLNRISERLGLEKFADIDTTDRHAVANFVGEFIGEMYNNGIGNTFDDATYNKKLEYPESQMQDELRKLDENYAAIEHHGDESQMEM